MHDNRKYKELRDIEGATGGKGGSGGGSESADTLQTNEIFKGLHLIGEGVVNLYTGDGQSIIINNIPLQNSDGSYNFGAYDQASGTTGLYTGGGSTYWEWRSGTPTQTPMTNPAFPSASAVFTVNQQVLGGTTVPLVSPAPATYAVTNSNVDYCKVVLNFPNGLVNVDSKGNITGDSVYIAIDVKPRSSGTWANALTRYINDKSSNPAAIQFQVNNPSSGNLWDIRVRRLTQDNSTATRKNQVYLLSVEEVQQVTLSYPGIAYAGLALDAATIGGSNASIPTVSFLVQRGPIAIPSNYNPATNTFSGSWDGTFTTGVTDDPAWILWDMLTNQQYGCYLYGIRASMIDKYSFYNASVFNNAPVADGHGGYEPRFTFNAPIQNRQQVLTTLQQVATMMNASLQVVNGLITLFQDRPQDPKYLINKSRVIASDKTNPVYFKYSSNDLTQRYTAVNVTWTNASNIQYLPNTTTVQDSTGLARYGYQATDIAAFGATTFGQATRAGKFWLFENLYNTETVEFPMGLEGFICQLDDVFELYDDDYAARAVGGRVVSATSNTITLDQPVIVDPSVTTKVAVLLQDGMTFESHTVTNTAGTYTTLNISGTFSTVPAQYTPYGVTSAVAPRTFKIKNIKVDGATKVVTITARLYDKHNYDYVEGSYTAPTAVYTQQVPLAPSAPTNLTAHASQYINPVDKQLSRGVTLEWDRPSSQNIAYVVKHRKDNGQYITSAEFQTNSYELHDILPGTYDFLVYSINFAGRYSAPATISYTLDVSGGGASSTLSEITNLQVVGGGTTWTGKDCHFQWTNPVANQGLLKDFLVTVKTTGGTVLRQVVADPVAGGLTQNYIYSFAMNASDGLHRSIKITVQGRDSLNNTTTGITATLTNPSPSVPSNINSLAYQQAGTITWTPITDSDIAGYIVWYSSTTGFTPGPSNAIDVGNNAIVQLTGLTKSTTYYYRIAAYDVFGKDLSGTGLNVSSESPLTVISSVGIPSGSTLPGSGLQGDLFFLTTDNKVYRYTGSAWTVATDGTDISPGTVTTNALAAGAVTTAKLSSGSVTTSILAAGAVTTTILAASSVTSSKISVSTLDAISANVGTLTAGLLSNNSGTNKINLSATGSSLFIDTPNFTVDAAGNATFSGALFAASGSFTGTLTGASGTFSGVLTASSVVTTDNIQSNAVTAADGDYEPAGVGTGAFGSSTLASCTITSIGAEVFVAFASIITATLLSSGSATYSFTVNRNGTAIYSTGTLYALQGGTFSGGMTSAHMPFCSNLIDVPGSGSVTYDLIVNALTNTNLYNINNSITAIELRR